MTRLHPLTRAAVLDAALALFERHGYATALDAKRWLRAHGYHAAEAAVSAHMDALHAAHAWAREEAEVYHVDEVPLGPCRLRDVYPVAPFFVYRPAGTLLTLADALGDLVHITLCRVG